MPSCQDFDTEALPHIDAAYNLAYWLVRNDADAHDVVQDAYLRAFKAFGQFNGGDIRPWLLTIVRKSPIAGCRCASATPTWCRSGRDGPPYGESGPAFEPPSDEPSAETC